jgi:hypothetical protein
MRPFAAGSHQSAFFSLFVALALIFLALLLPIQVFSECLPVKGKKAETEAVSTTQFCHLEFPQYFLLYTKIHSILIKNQITKKIIKTLEVKLGQSKM